MSTRKYYTKYVTALIVSVLATMLLIFFVLTLVMPAQAQEHIKPNIDTTTQQLTHDMQVVLKATGEFKGTRADHKLVEQSLINISNALDKYTSYLKYESK